jgi:hypothetical protein
MIYGEGIVSEVLYSQGDFDASVKYLEQAYELQPTPAHKVRLNTFLPAVYKNT